MTFQLYLVYTGLYYSKFQLYLCLHRFALHDISVISGLHRFVLQQISVIFMFTQVCITAIFSYGNINIKAIQYHSMLTYHPVLPGNRQKKVASTLSHLIDIINRFILGYEPSTKFGCSLCPQI